MAIKALNDAGGWGQALVNEAKKQGIEADVVETSAGVGHKDLFFARIAQKKDRREKEVPEILRARGRGARLIPDYAILMEYESKIEQSKRYKGWMPETYYITEKEEAEKKKGVLGYPFVSKASTGSASKNVRLIKNEEQARKEIDSAFGSGLSAPHGLGERNQRGYLLWQRFVPDNGYDYRACIVGDKIMLLRRGNRKDVPFASGSGITEPIRELNDETESVLEFAYMFFRKFKMGWCGIDIVKDYDKKEWRMLETTIGWKQSAYSDCVFFDRFGNDMSARGKDIWKVFCDYIGRYL